MGFLFKFISVSIVLWIVFLFIAKLVLRIVTRAMGASIAFRFAGCNCLRDVVLKLNKGAVESICVGEIRLSLRKSLVTLGAFFGSGNPKLHFVICNLEIVTRSSGKSTSKPRTKKSSGSGKGKAKKIMVLANMARFLSITLIEFGLKTPKASLDIQELRVDISKVGGSEPGVFVKMLIFPIKVYLGKSHVAAGLSENASGSFSNQLTAGACSAFTCEEFALLCEFGHCREAGLVVRNLDITTGEICANLNEELLLKEKSSSDTSHPPSEVVPAANSVSTKNPKEKQPLSAVMLKYTSMFPEKASFILPKIGVKFAHRSFGLLFENDIIGIQLKCMKSRVVEDSGESIKLGVQLEFSEIHLLREIGIPVVEILKLDIATSACIPLQPNSPIKSEVNVKLGGTQCNLVLHRLEQWMRIRPPPKQKKKVLEENSSKGESKSSEQKAIMWTCTFSAPEITVVLYCLSGSPLICGCLQSSHLHADNITTSGTKLRAELGELNLQMSEEYQESLKEDLYSMETNNDSLLHINKVNLNLGKGDPDSNEDASKMVLGAGVAGIGVYLTFRRIESLLSTALSLKILMKKMSSSSKKSPQSKETRSSKPSGKGIQLLRLNLEKCSLYICGDTGLDDSVIPDPKRVNYGSQGGRILITNSADGTLRTAHIMPTVSDECKKLKYSISLDIYNFKLCTNKEKRSIQVDLENAKSTYQEYPEDNNAGTKVPLLDVQNVKFVKRTGGLKEIEVCSLFSATDISLRWEPDMHIALFELGLRMKSMMAKHKPQQNNDGEKIHTVKDDQQKKEASLEPVKLEKPVKKKEPVFAVDVEMLSISAEIGDGVETFIQVQSIFSENARIGILLEGLLLHLNGARLFRSSRMQISRVPNPSGSVSDGKSEMVTIWDWVIQALDVHICLPFRLELRAIDDAVEEMIRVLKLVSSAKTKNILPPKKEVSRPPKKSSSTKFGRIKVSVRKLIADIEEEPIQGWLDEHYRLMKKEAHDLAVRLSFLDDLISGGSQNSGAADQNDSCEGKAQYNGEEIDFQDASAVQKLRDEMYKKSFESYYQACQRIFTSKGSGACKEGFQSGFKLSTTRTSLFTVYASELDCSVTKIEGGDAGMIEVLQKLDPVCRAHNIPFARLYGGNIKLRANSIVAQIRDYTYPLLATTDARCEGRIVLAQQATCFQPQVHQDVYIGRWRKVDILRSASGTTPPMKTFLDLPVHFHKGEVSFGVSYEPPFADLSYAFTVALRRANLCVRNPNPPVQPPKKEKSLPWWDEMRNYIHGHTTLYFSKTTWHLFATTDPYEKTDKLTVVTGYMEIQQSDGHVYASVKDFKIFASSLERLLKNSLSKQASEFSPPPFLEVPAFNLDVTMEWDCESGSPLNHYLFALPNEGVPRDKVFDPFRSTALILGFNIYFGHSPSSDSSKSQSSSLKDQATQGEGSTRLSETDSKLSDSPQVNLGPHDVAWLSKFVNINVIPPHKLRMFSRFKRIGIPLIPRSGNLSLDRVMTDIMIRLDAIPLWIRHIPIHEDDPSKGLTLKMTKVLVEVYFGRGKQKFTFDCERDPPKVVYMGLDFNMPNVYTEKEDCTTISNVIQTTGKNSQSAPMGRNTADKNSLAKTSTERPKDDGFFLSSTYVRIRKQSPKADSDKLLEWQESGKRNLEMLRSEFENESESNDQSKSDDQSDDDACDEVIADDCGRISVCGLKLLWTLENRDAVLSCARAMAKAVQSKPSPSRAYAQRKLREENARVSSDTEKNDNPELQNNDPPDTQKNDSPDMGKKDQPDTQKKDSPENEKKDDQKDPVIESTSSSQSTENSKPVSSQSTQSSSGTGANPFPTAISKSTKTEESEEEGTRNFMVNVIEPQFNLHSEDANGRFLLAASSGRVLARSFHSVLQVGHEMIEQALGGENIQVPDTQPAMAWNRRELTVMLEHVQAHVAPTDVDPGAGIQWLPKIRRGSPKVKRTGALLERVFMPCDMYFQFTRHNGAISDVKVKPLKELAFNSHNITASMTSRQFQVMLDVLTNLLFARTPKPRTNSLTYSTEDDEDEEEEADEVVPDGIEEVELEKINVEQKERIRQLIINDIKKFSVRIDMSGEPNQETEMDLWMINCGMSTLVQKLKLELSSAQKSRKAASASLRTALQKAAQVRLMEKEKNKTPSCAMHVSFQINKVVLSMLVDGKSFAETEINDLIYDFDRDYKDIGVAKFTIKFFVIRNCLPNAKSDSLLAPWNPPSEWGKKVMLRVDSKQGPPKEGRSTIELFQVEIYPLKIHLAESFYKVMWQYFFPEEQQDSQRRQEVWKVSTTAGARRVKKGPTPQEGSPSVSQTTKDAETSESSQTSKHHKTGSTGGSKPGLRRTSSFDKTWEESVAESVANELVMEMEQEDIAQNKLKDMKQVKTGRSAQEEKKAGKVVQDTKSTQPRRLREFRNIKISQVELLLTYEGSRFAVSDVRLLMDTFHRAEFTGTWSRLFSRVKKHIIWGVLKSMTGMQGKKFKDKSTISVPEGLTLSDSDGGTSEKTDQSQVFLPKRTDGAGDGFVTSVRGLFSNQRRKAKAFVLRTMRGEAENEAHGEWSEGEAELSPFARQLSVSKAKRLIRRHTKNLRGRQKGLSFDLKDSNPESPTEMTSFDSDSSSESSPYAEHEDGSKES
ncbi:protein SABRE-like [Andrographis paniculata]|uniref:protein SABRE-like n=1 Tax=Andrographis paniculata TaxID=175694 RepID=UPI0021E6D882|nr:protein SABRE-like [Andrographis paniculata]